MIPVKLTVQNFLPYKAPNALDFSGISVACLSGENGAGKSSILDAMTWSLWGKARDGKRSDEELIHHGESEMMVQFEFQLGTELYQVIRRKKGGKRAQTVLELQMYDTKLNRWYGISEAKVRATQKKINELLRLDYDTFVNSAFILQGRADLFTVKTSGERKAILANILGLDQWSSYEKSARDKISDLRSDLKVFDAEIANIDRELLRKEDYEADLKNAQTQLEGLEAQLKAAEQELADVTQARQKLADARRRIDTLNGQVMETQRELREIDKELTDTQTQASVTALETRLKSVVDALAQMEAKETRRATLQTERNSQAEVSARLQGENNVMMAQADPLKTRISTLEATEEAVCPTCGEALSVANRKKLIKDLKADLAEKRNQYRANQAEYKQLADRISDADRELKALDSDLKQGRRLQKQQAELEAGIKTAEQAKERIAPLEARQKRWHKMVADQREQLTALRHEAGEYEVQATEADRRQKKLDDLRFEQRIVIEQVGSARQSIAAMKGLQRQRETKVSERQAVAENIGLYEELRKAFGKQGVPAMIIEAAVPELEETTNAFLTRMTNGRMAVRFETQRETQAGKTVETLDIKISDELGTRNYEMYSGGEAFRVNFAIRVALSKLLARRAGAQLQTLVIDEGFGTQDVEGRERLIEAINAVQNDFDTVLVITHIDELKNAFPTQIHVKKTANGSVFEVE